MYLIGLDLGTTGCKSMVFDTMGRIFGEHYIEYEVIFLPDGGAEQDAERSRMRSCGGSMRRKPLLQLLKRRGLTRRKPPVSPSAHRGVHLFLLAATESRWPMQSHGMTHAHCRRRGICMRAMARRTCFTGWDILRNRLYSRRSCG